MDHLFKNTQSFSLIFVDNGSTDGTTDYVRAGEAEGKWTGVYLRENTGVITGRNIGFKHVTASYFVNLDNDQYVGPGWLESLHAKLSEGYDVAGCEAWKLFPPGSKGTLVHNGVIINGREYYPQVRCTRPTDQFTYIGCGGMLVKTEVVKNIGLFDEQFSPAYFEDPDFAFRAIQNGYRLAWAPTCRINHLAHQTLGTQKSFKQTDQFFKSWGKFKAKWKGYFPNDPSKFSWGQNASV